MHLVRLSVLAVAIHSGSTAAAAPPPLFDVPWVGYDTASWPDGLYPYDAAGGDYDGDGAPDLAIVTFLVGTPHLNVLFGDGEGGYRPPVTYQILLESAGVAALDWDHDGDLDLAISDTDRFYGGSTVSIWRNDGRGGFALHASYPVGDTGPAGIVAADLDGDGWVDLATANDGDIECNNTVSILRNDEGRGFVAAQVVTIGNCPEEIAAADVDGDGDLDLVVGHGQANRWTLLVNDGGGGFADGGFTPGIPSGPLAENAALCVADIDLDGHVDVLYAQQDSGGVGAGAIGLWRGSGEGAFGPAEILSFGFWNRGGVDIASGDVTGDGWPDLLAVTGVEGNWFLFPSDGAGGFGAARRYRAGHRPNAVRLEDLDGDGDLDVTVIAAWSLEACVYLNPGDGSFVQPPTIDMADPALAPAFVANLQAGDVDGDGDLDLVSGFRADFSGTHGLTVRRNDGDGSFGPRETYPEPVFPAWIELADTDGDGDLDLLYLDANARFHIRANDGQGGFGPRLTRHAFSLQADDMQIRAVDVDGDGDLDVCANTGFFHRISRNLGDNAFAVPFVAANLGVFTQTFTYGDIDADGDLDLVTDAGSQGAAVRVCLGNGDGTFGGPVSIEVTERDVHSIRLVDLDHDGNLDLTAIHDRTPKGLTVRLGDGAGGFGPMQSYGTSFFFDQYTPGGTTAVIDVDGDGFEDLLFANTYAQDVSFWRNRGDGTLDELVRYGAGHDVSDLAAGDFDGDGDVDVALAADIDDGQWFHAGAVLIRGVGGSPAVPADVDGDGAVDVDDLVAVMLAWGPCPASTPCAADVDGSGTVDVDDLVAVLLAWS